MLDDLIKPLLRCPVCRSTLHFEDVSARCVNTDCRYGSTPFQKLSGRFAFVDFDNSILFEDRFFGSSGASQVPARRVGALQALARKLASGENVVAAGNAEAFLKAVKERAPHPLILIVGGGTRGAGTETLYADKDCKVVAFDVYDSPDATFIADAHEIPLAEGSVDGVWIQAVLEHVVEPERVVASIHRVLAPSGVVYAETTFLQAVHEGAYDFTRFTHSGHRWLFRSFEEIGSGAVGGPGTSMLWSIRAVMRGLFNSPKIATLLTAPFFWVRYIDRLTSKAGLIDGAWGVYFLGRKSDRVLGHKDMVAYYRGSGPR